MDPAHVIALDAICKAYVSSKFSPYSAEYDPEGFADESARQVQKLCPFDIGMHMSLVKVLLVGEYRRLGRKERH